LNIGVLPVQVSSEADAIFKAIEADPKQNLKLAYHQTITLKATGQQESFDINGYKKTTC
jgi:3-isopropylmalate/(R)-2-methylmalate dehydratase small subunit